MKLTVFSAVVLGFLAFADLNLASAADVSGTWLMMVETSAGAGMPTFTLVQKGETLTGTYKGQLGEAPVKGTVKGDYVSIEYKIDAQGQTLTIQYVGKVSGNAMSGTVSLGQFGDGTFKGTKQ